MSKFKEFWLSRKDTLVLSILASIALPLILCVAVPLEIFKNNMLEFTFSLMDFLPWCLFWFFCLASLIFVISNLLPRKPRKIVLFICLILAFLCFVQGTYLNAGINSLNGDGISTTKISTLTKILNITIWVMFIGGFIVLACLSDKKGRIKAVSLVLVSVVLAVQAINILVSACSDTAIYKNSAERKGIAKAENKYLTSKDITIMAQERNVYYFLVDRFDIRYAEKAYAEDNTVFDNLTGFTWFRDYLSKYVSTFPSVASIITGTEYDTETHSSIFDYLSKEYMKEGTLLDIMHKNGYVTKAYVPEFYVYNGINSMPDYVANFEKVNQKSNKKFILSINMIQLALFRVSPLLAKSIFGNIGTSTLNQYFHYEAESGNQGWDSSTKDFWDLINAKEFKISGDKQFSFIHFEGCHDTLYDTNWNKTNVWWDESKVTYSVVNSIKIINKFIDNLKANGLYENATIIISGDHGHGGNGLASLFVKPSGAGSEPLKQSYAQVHQDNLWKTIFDSEGINSGLELKRSVFEISETETVARKFFSNYAPRQEYKVLGNARNRSSYTLL